MNIKRVYVTKFLGVHIYSHLNWGEHINHIKRKISKNVSIMRRVKHLLIDSALYSLYSTLVMPYLNFTLLPCPIKSRPTSGDSHDRLPPGVPISS